MQEKANDHKKTAQTCITITSSICCACLISAGGLSIAEKRQEKKEIPEAQEKSHEICKNVLNKNSEIEK